MKVYSITDARKNLGELIKRVKYGKETIALGQHGKAEVFLVSLPQGKDSEEDTIDFAKFAEQSGAFDFLADEPDLYSIHDCTEIYD